MQKPKPLPAPLDKSGFTVHDGRRAGVTRARMRNSGVVKIGRGLRAPKDIELDFAGRVRPYTRINTSSYASHDTAAILLKLHGPAGGYSEKTIHITRPSKTARVRRPNVTSHCSRLFPDELVLYEGIYLTSRARTWLDLAETSSLDHLVVVADQLIRVPRRYYDNRADPYATLEQLAGLLERHPGKPGIRKAREALKLARVGADSPPETKLRLAIIRAGLPEPRVNEPLIDDDGIARHCPDLSYRKYRLAIEYLGEPHNSPDQVVKDVARAEDTEDFNWKQVDITKSHMQNGGQAAVRKIRTALTKQGWKGAA
jgi:hypothetical protein